MDLGIELTPKPTGERIKEYLKENKRFDGRKKNEYRELKIETGISKNAEGSARVKIGKTEVIAGIKMKSGEPYPDAPEEGNLMVSAELLPLSSPRYENGPPKFPAIELGRIIDRGIRESGYIDVKGLCIKKGEKVWTVFVDIVSINDDGNLLDAAGIAAVSALKTAKIPEYNEEEDKVEYDKPTDKKLPVADKAPIPITVHKIGEGLVVDPTKEEEDLSDTRLTVGSVEGIISSVQKGGEKSLSSEEIKEALEMVEKIEKEISSKINKSLK